MNKIPSLLYVYPNNNFLLGNSLSSNAILIPWIHIIPLFNYHAQEITKIQIHQQVQIQIKMMIDQYLLNASSTTSLGITNSHFYFLLDKNTADHGIQFIQVHNGVEHTFAYWTSLRNSGGICSWIVEWFLHREFVVQRNTSQYTLNNFHVTLLQKQELNI